MHNNPRLGYLPVGFVDDDVRKQGFHIHGVEVLGTTTSLPRILETHAADELIIAIPSATRSAIQVLVNRCLQSGLPFKIVPSIAALSEGRSHVSQLRPVRVEDLLGREPVNLDTSRIRRDIAGRRVIITGAGGSIGAELARQVADYGPATLVLIERSESALFLIEQELRRRHAELEIRAMICDVQEVDDVTCCFREVRPEIVYHAAAYKHVPLMEGHLAQAIRNNVFGTFNVAKLAHAYGAKFVLISTDKAVAPSNVMGATKRLAERLVLSLNGSSRSHFVAVRFGNVLGSNGSVVPLFSQQIADGGPVTVTHPEATRYFMTIPEAVGLVLQASVLEEARDRVVMLEMGEPVKIVDLARNLIRLSGLEPDVDVPIVFTGLRHGEKLHEQLTADAEETVATEYEKIRIVRTKSPSVGPAELEALGAAVRSRDERAILRRMQELVPEFSPQTSLLSTLRDRAGVHEPPQRNLNIG
jgi:FlaA1/EpsC-like NDP-sugar epimerase